MSLLLTYRMGLRSCFKPLEMGSPRVCFIRALSCAAVPCSVENLSSTPTIQLLGPPEIYANKSSLQSSASGDPFMDLMTSKFNKGLQPLPQPHIHQVTTPTHPYRGYTENNSLTFKSSGNPCLDFFFHVVPDTPPVSLTNRLQLAWEHDPLTTLKLICHLRGVRGTGKSDKEGFYTAALWLHKNHPKTLANNVKWIPQFGYYKDLPEILYRLLEGSNIREVEKGIYHNWKMLQENPKARWRMEKPNETASASPGWVEFAKDPSTGCVYYYNEHLHKSQWVSPSVADLISESPAPTIPLPPDWEVGVDDRKRTTCFKNKSSGRTKKCIGCSDGGWGRSVHEWGYCDICTRNQGRKLGVPLEARLAAEKEKRNVKRNREVERKTEISFAKAKNTVERYYNDEDFRCLHDEISQVFADQLVADLKSFECGDPYQISLASKWCPNLYSGFDKITLLCESIAKRIFPRESYSEYEGIEEAHYAYRVRDRLRKQVLVPLHKVKNLPEIYMSANKWDILPYNYVPSVAMTIYKKLFLKHDQERFTGFLGKVARGEAKVAAGALLPHRIIQHLYDGERDSGQVAELQWKRMVDDMSANGKLKNCIAVCDVSGSMTGKPMEVCVALGLLISELSEDPWKGNVITFSENPVMHKIQGNSLLSKAQFIRHMQWGANTDFQKVFDVILQVAVSGNLTKDEMIRRVFVFSDMEFDDARNSYSYQLGSGYQYQVGSGYPYYTRSFSKWDTDYEIIKQKFEARGFTVPELVFWNLRDSSSTPVLSDQKGVALLSGFSKNLMKLFLDEKEKEIPSPEAVMELALSGPEYKQLVVVD